MPLKFRNHCCLVLSQKTLTQGFKSWHWGDIISDRTMYIGEGQNPNTLLPTMPQHFINQQLTKKIGSPINQKS